MKVKWLMVVCLLMVGLVAVGCAPTKTPTPKAAVPAGYERIRIVGGSLGSASATTPMAIASVFSRYYPGEIQWSSASGNTGVNPILITQGTVQLAIAGITHFVDAYGFDKTPQSRVKSLNLPTALAHYFFLIPKDKPWTDITQVPQGSSIGVDRAGTIPKSYETLLTVAGLGKEYFKSILLTKDELKDAWLAGKIDAAWVAPTGTLPFLMEMYTSPRSFKPMGMSAQLAAKAKSEQAFERFGFETPVMGHMSKISPELYKYDVISPQNAMFLVSRDDFPADIAYKIAKVMDEQSGELAKIFPPLEFATPQWHIKWARPPYEIHSGVAKYYREKGYLK